mmetsp:Transcript_38115/g.120062  ORF Transcript_38115/g.120062 Transcript_38115/m.120062 type:complete len:362 (-) Transcript_38115:362-1447(-)
MRDDQVALYRHPHLSFSKLLAQLDQSKQLVRVDPPDRHVHAQPVPPILLLVHPEDLPPLPPAGHEATPCSLQPRPGQLAVPPPHFLSERGSSHVVEQEGKPALRPGVVPVPPVSEHREYACSYLPAALQRHPGVKGSRKLAAGAGEEAAHVDVPPQVALVVSSWDVADIVDVGVLEQMFASHEANVELPWEVGEICVALPALGQTCCKLGAEPARVYQLLGVDPSQRIPDHVANVVHACLNREDVVGVEEQNMTRQVFQPDAVQLNVLPGGDRQTALLLEETLASCLVLPHYLVQGSPLLRGEDAVGTSHPPHECSRGMFLPMKESQPLQAHVKVILILDILSSPFPPRLLCKSVKIVQHG